MLALSFRLDLRTSNVEQGLERGPRRRRVLSSGEGHDAVVKLILAHPSVVPSIADRSGESALIAAAREKIAELSADSVSLAATPGKPVVHAYVDAL